MFTLLFLASSAFAAQPAVAASPDQQLGEGIAAVVGSDAISSYDVDSRVKFIIVTARLSNTPEVIQRIRPQVIRSLIDERLELQEADKNDIKITDGDIKKAVADIEAQRGMPPGEIDIILKDNGVPESTFLQQVRAQLAWSKLLMKKVRPQVRVSDDEIALAMRKLAIPPAVTLARNEPQELKIAVITLPVDKPAHETEIRRLGEKLAREARSGASFEEISRQFSSGAATAGGRFETFWISPQQLDPHVAQALAGAAKGAITPPVRTDAGYVIIKVYDIRAMSGGEEQESAASPTGTQVTLKEILLKLKPDAPDKDADLLLQIGEDVAKHPGTCQEKGIAGVKDIEDFDIETDRRVAFMSDLPPALQTIAESLKVGDISAPFASDEGIRLYMLCDRKDNVVKTPGRDEVYRMLLQQKMELEAQKYLRNLRREAFIEIR